ncbi:hypothetical protein AVEN_47960-1 [Araneus ventricosus]|uniref:Uncharacterized protein n=1 Tax=Araneus ventricosus TaxID=182803 RepID=A0A4Y2DRD2_ARAVE|nr:hypothetical protein AVEN_47960-1 [Araneus ventricosus]
MWVHMIVSKNMVMVSWKEKISHSIRKIEKKISSSECEKNFPRKRGLHSNQFIYPENGDISVVNNDNIVKKLPKPAVDAPTAFGALAGLPIVDAKDCLLFVRSVQDLTV